MCFILSQFGGTELQRDLSGHGLGILGSGPSYSMENWPMVSVVLIILAYPGWSIIEKEVGIKGYLIEKGSP